MFESPLVLVILAGALLMFFTWALEVHRTLREALLELRRRAHVENQVRALVLCHRLLLPPETRCLVGG